MEPTPEVDRPAPRAQRDDLVYHPGDMPPLYGDTAAALIVDDDDQLGGVLTRLLTREGYCCTAVSNAVDARSLLSMTDFALVLVDVMMPGESGLELAADMLAHHRDLAVVMVTGVDDPHLGELALASGAYGYVVKPFQPNQLLITVANAGRRRCLEIAGRAYEQRLQHRIDEQADDLEQALARLEQPDHEVEMPNKSQAKFQAMVEAAPDALIAVDEQGHMALVNAQAERLFGYHRDELLGRPIEMLVPEHARAVHPARRASYFADPNPRPRPMGVGSELAGRRKDGTEFPAEISLSTVDTQEGLLVSVAVRDATERIQASAEHERLEAEAERQRLENRLNQSRRLESLGQLAGGVAHDFNNLLAVILNYIAFIGEEVATAAGTDDGDRWALVSEDVRQVQRAAERATELTHQLLAFGRREVAQPRVLNLNEVVSGVEQLLRRSIGERVELFTVLAPDLWSVMADLGQLEQVLVNLAVNARDAMPAGGTLTIDTDNVTVDEGYMAVRPGLAPGRHVRLRASDTGLGMERDVLAQAFEPFFTTKPKGEGSGLGLATVYGILTQAGGYAQMYSEPGLGTTFTALLPATDHALSDSDPPAEQTRRGGGETVLVVEDEDAMREVTRRILARNGHEVLVAASGEEALAVASGHGADIELLLTDVVMPQMLGKEVAERVVALRPDIRVLYMSGYALPVLASKGTLAEGVALIEKPFTEPGLLAKIREVLDG